MTLRRHNEGSIYQRADGRKVAAVSLDDGRRVTRYCPHRHQPRERNAACAESRALLKELLRLRDDGAADGSRMTLGQYLRGWLTDVRPKLAPATWRKHESICRNHLDRGLGVRRLSELSVGDVRRYLAAAGERVGPQSVRHHRATLRRALADALRDGLVTRNVAALAEPPPLPHRERAILTAEQVRVFLAGLNGYALPAGQHGPVLPPDRLRALWILLTTTGMREGEALALTWDVLDLDGGTLRVEDTLHAVGKSERERRKAEGDPDWDRRWERRAPKTAKSRRTVTLPAMTVEALREHRRRQLEEWLAAGRPGEAGMVFVDLRGRPIHGSKLTTLLYLILDRLGLPRVTVHDLRHSAATIAYAAGVPLEAIADNLGHSTVRVTQDLYRHRVPELQRGLSDAMERALG